MNHRLAPTKAVPNLPPHFEQHFIEGGWRRVERVYGCRDEVVLKWIEVCGGMDAMKGKRAKWVRERAEEARQAAWHERRFA